MENVIHFGKPTCQFCSAGMQESVFDPCRLRIGRGLMKTDQVSICQFFLQSPEFSTMEQGKPA